MRGKMIALQTSAIKDFMSGLLTTDIFHPFLLEEAVIKTANTFTIDGRINRDFYAGSLPSETDAGTAGPQESLYEFQPWSEMKGLCFNLIKGKRTPLFLQFVLHLMPDQAESLLAKSGCDMSASQVKALVLTIRYDGSCVQLITGTSYSTFTLSKEADAIWDRALEKYLRLKGIDCENL